MPSMPNLLHSSPEIHRIMDRGINHRHAFGRPFRPFPPKVEGTAREF